MANAVYVYPITSGGDPSGAGSGLAPTWITLFHIAEGSYPEGEDSAYVAGEEVDDLASGIRPGKPTITVHETSSHSNSLYFTWDPLLYGEVAGWIDLGVTFGSPIERYLFVTMYAPPVTTGNITVGPVTLADGAITAAKIANNSITVDKIANNSITVDKIADNAITAAKLANNSITVDKIADNAITAAKIASDSCTKLWNTLKTTVFAVSSMGELVVNYLNARVSGVPEAVWSYNVPSNVSGSRTVTGGTVDLGSGAVNAIWANETRTLTSESGGGSGTTLVSIDHNYPIADNLLISSDGIPIDGATIKVYLTSDWVHTNNGRYDRHTSAYVLGTAITGSDGRWLTPIYINSGYTYTLVVEKSPDYGPDIVQVSVS